MVSLFSRGRIAWILAIVVGIIVLIIGIATNTVFLIIVGIALIILGGIFLALSYGTRGQTD